MLGPEDADAYEEEVLLTPSPWVQTCPVRLATGL